MKGMKKSKKLSQKMVEIGGTVQKNRDGEKAKEAGKNQFPNPRKGKGAGLLGLAYQSLTLLKIPTASFPG